MPREESRGGRARRLGRFFVSVNQVLVRLWARCVAMSDRMGSREGPSSDAARVQRRGCIPSGWDLLCAE